METTDKKSEFLKIIDLLRQPVKELKYSFNSTKNSTEADMLYPTLDASASFTVASWDYFMSNARHHYDVRYDTVIHLDPLFDSSDASVHNKHDFNESVWQDLFFVVEILLRENNDEYVISARRFCVERLAGLCPDFVFLNRAKNEVYFIVEARSREEIETKSDEKLCDLLNSSSCSQRTTQIIGEVHSYITKLNVKYCVLTTHFQTWFIEFKNNVLYISDTLYCTSENPSLLQCVAYFMHLGRQGPSTSRENTILRVTDSDKMQKNIEIDCCLSTFYQRSCASVFRGNMGSSKLAVKIIDRVKRPDLFVVLQNEIAIYTKHLKDLQGKVIPEFYFLFNDGHRFGFATQFIGEALNADDVSSDRIEKIVDALVNIHDKKVQHGSLNVNNVVRNEQDQVFIVGFSSAVPSCTQDELSLELGRTWAYLKVVSKFRAQRMLATD